jgi:hypothetical protein
MLSDSSSVCWRKRLLSTSLRILPFSLTVDFAPIWTRLRVTHLLLFYGQVIESLIYCHHKISKSKWLDEVSYFLIIAILFLLSFNLFQRHNGQRKREEVYDSFRNRKTKIKLVSHVDSERSCTL